MFEASGKILKLIPVLILLQACVSYEPAVLTPAVTLSAESVNLVDSGTRDAGISFGLEVASNESDSLFNVEVLPGVRVREVITNGPAAAAGIAAGDVILEVNGTPTNNPDAFLSLQQYSDTTTQRFLVQRNTTVFEASVTPRLLNSAPPPIELYRIDPLATRAGYRSQLVSLEGEGKLVAARIEALFANSPLPNAGLSEGDLILALNGRYLNSAQDLVTRLNTDHELGSEVVLTRYRDERIEDVRVNLWDPGRRISRFSLGPLFRFESSLSPESRSVTLLDLWLFSLYSYSQLEGERSHSILGLINVSSDYGELVEESSQAPQPQ
ncbi:MAG: PDZ domain-containing protein [Proteobacteria bacterium]|jgi:serine protease Do|nr:PDZ domain-containing protein [Pseudomonadota bacterium]